MKPKIKIVYSSYYRSQIILPMLKHVKKYLKFDYDTLCVEGSFEIPFAIARSIKEDKTSNEVKLSSFKGKEKEKIRENIIQMTKLSQLNLDNQCIYSGYLALGCIIKGKTINHEAISTAIFTNLQRISIENNMPIGNGIFNANNIDEAKKKYKKCANQATNVIHNLLNY